MQRRVKMKQLRISNVAYHRIPKLSHSILAQAKHSMLMAYVHSAFNPDLEEEKKSDSLAFGSLYHTLVDHPEIVAQCETYLSEFNKLTEKYLAAKAAKKPAEQPVVSIETIDGAIHVADFGLSRKNKAYDAVADKYEGDGDIIVNPDEFEKACTMVKCLVSHPVYTSLHADAEIIGNEMTLVGELDGIDYKVRIDRLLKTSDGKYMCIDWKTTKDVDVENMRRMGQRIHYDLQDELYRRFVSEYYGVPMSDVNMVFLFQSKEHPLIVYALKFTSAHERRAQNEREMLAADFMERLNRNIGLAGFVPVQTDIIEFAYYEDALTEYVPII